MWWWWGGMAQVELSVAVEVVVQWRRSGDGCACGVVVPDVNRVRWGTWLALWWSVSANATATVSLSCFAQARSRRSCNAASAFVTTAVSKRLTVRVDLEPKWLRRWRWWCVGGRPSRSLSRTLLVLVRPLISPFGDLCKGSPMARSAPLTTITGKDWDDSQHANRVIQACGTHCIFVMCGFSLCPINPEESHTCGKISKNVKMSYLPHGNYYRINSEKVKI